MKILSAHVNWMKGWGNLPTLVVIVDKLPQQEDLRYTEREAGAGSTTYWAADGPYVAFFTHTPHDQHGYGGHVFNVTMEDGSTRSVKGPWSDSALYVNSRGLPPCVEVTYKEEGHETGGGMAGAIRTSTFISLVEVAGAEVAVIKQYGDDAEVAGVDRELTLLRMKHDQPLFLQRSLTVKMKGMTLAQSQVEKNK